MREDQRWREVILGQAKDIAETLATLAVKVEREVHLVEIGGPVEGLPERVEICVELGTDELNRQLRLMTGALRVREASKILRFPEAE